MEYKLGDHVRVTESGQTGYICDDHIMKNGIRLYIVELDNVELSEEDSIWDILKTVDASQIERIW